MLNRTSMWYRLRSGKTKAEPQADGTYKISGTKIFISAGEHDLTENIIHIVLASSRCTSRYSWYFIIYRP